MSVSRITPNNQPPMRSVYCLKNRKRIEDVEKIEDCFILEFDSNEREPFDHLSSMDQVDDNAPSIAVVAERGKMACRDYPHPRFLCVVHPFDETAHEICCKMCYCHVCDTPAPCKEWTKGALGNVTMHCDATQEAYANLGYTYPSGCETETESDNSD